MGNGKLGQVNGGCGFDLWWLNGGCGKGFDVQQKGILAPLESAPPF